MHAIDFFVTFSFTSFCLAQTLDWSYKDQSIWPSISPTCSGPEQSPIDINRAKTIVNESLSIELLNYDRAHAGYSVINNGHSVQFNYIGDKSTIPTITGSALNGEKFHLAQFHSHWGINKGEGSEHTIDGQSFSLETHFVHYNSKYETLIEALGKPNGVTVLAVFYQIDRQSNSKLDDVVTTIKNSYIESTEIKFGLRLIDLLPDNLNNFYRYPGSLTTPPCTEKIIWLVLDKPAIIGLSQIDTYRAVKNEKESTELYNNFRFIQLPRKRLIEASFNTLNSSASVSATFTLILTFVFFAFHF